MSAVPSFDGASPSHAVYALVRALSTRPVTTPRRTISDASTLASYCSQLANEAGYASEQVSFYEDELDRLLSSGVPFVFVPMPQRRYAYAVTGASGRRCTFVDPAGGSVSVPRAVAAEVLSSGNGERARSLATLIGGADGAEDPRLVQALSRELRSARPIGWGFVFRPNSAESVRRVLRSLGLGTYLGGLLALSGAQSLLTTAGWAVIGSLAIAGHAETGSVLGWALLSATATLLQVAGTRFVGRFTVRAATALRQRLLEGALDLEPGGLGALGLGGLMAVSAQADAFPSAVIALFIALLGVVTNVAASVAVLSVAPLPGLTVPGFALFVVIALVMAPRVASSAADLEQERMRLTTDMVERMLGHRTRLVQQPPSSWHEGEDESVHSYATNSRRLDRTSTLLRMLPRAYYVASVVSLFCVIVTHPTQEALALTIGGMALGMASVASLVDLVLSGAALHASWRAVRPVARDAVRPTPLVDADAPSSEDDDAAAHGDSAPVVELRGVRFAYPGRAKPVLDDASLSLVRGERVLVEGRSGGGKTTLATLLAGLRRPDAGLVLVRGLDQHSIREADLRRTVAFAPQFYENHVLSQSLAFNLLMGRCWPPSDEDVKEATSLARQLGLGPLLDRMPSGIFQHVGESGWQLSHGEKSRVYLARTLLQRSNVVVLDETFGALDPDTLRRCMRVVDERAQTLVVITHR